MATYENLIVYESGRIVHPTTGSTISTDSNFTVTGKLTAADDMAVDGDLVVAGSLTVQGAITSIETTNLEVTDNLIMLNDGVAANTADSGLIIERGTTGDNAAIIWDESVDKFTLGTTTADATEIGDIAVTKGVLIADLEGDVTFGNLVGALGATVTRILDEDNMASDSATALATQQSIKAYVDSAITSGEAGSLAADNITAGDAAVEITTTTGDIVVDAPTGQSVDLQVAGSNVVEVAADRVDLSQPLILGGTAGVSLTASQAATIAVGNILSVNASGHLVLADADSSTEQVKELVGVALESSTTEKAIMINTVHGSKINVVTNFATDGVALTAGKPVYLSTTPGAVTATAPSDGYVYRVGIALETTTTETDADILWMPQFIADLG
jgi:hypothetical protein